MTQSAACDVRAASPRCRREWRCMCFSQRDLCKKGLCNAKCQSILEPHNSEFRSQRTEPRSTFPELYLNVYKWSTTKDFRRYLLILLIVAANLTSALNSHFTCLPRASVRHHFTMSMCVDVTCIYAWNVSFCLRNCYRCFNFFAQLTKGEEPSRVEAGRSFSRSSHRPSAAPPLPHLTSPHPSLSPSPTSPHPHSDPRAAAPNITQCTKQ